MPTFDYRCTGCGKKYDVFHKVREIEEDVVCPQCGSKNHKKVMSVTSMSMAGSSPGAASYNEAPSSCDSCCNNGMCGMN